VGQNALQNTVSFSKQFMSAKKSTIPTSDPVELVFESAPALRSGTLYRPCRTMVAVAYQSVTIVSTELVSCFIGHANGGSIKYLE
jgi:hypothetical protein